jgi:lysophospholipase L1-like esterase
VRTCRDEQSLPVLATLLPTNPPHGSPTLDARAAWLEDTNRQLRDLSASQGIPLADTHAAFMADRDPSRLFSDGIHPNERGYELMAEVFFRAITEPRASAAPNAIAARTTVQASGAVALPGSRKMREK